MTFKKIGIGGIVTAIGAIKKNGRMCFIRIVTRAKISMELKKKARTISVNFMKIQRMHIVLATNMRRKIRWVN
jgi:hypothetical protein